MASTVITDRRSFCSAIAVAATGLDASMRVGAQTDTNRRSPAAPADSERHNVFASLRHVDAGDLHVEYADCGPIDGAVSILLHGWPYDIHSFVEVSALLSSAGCHVIIPYLRGYGGTRFLSNATPRNGQQAMLARDVIDLMDVLKVQKATLAGFDWGGRTANIIAALWPITRAAPAPSRWWPGVSRKQSLDRGLSSQPRVNAAAWRRANSAAEIGARPTNCWKVSVMRS